MVSISEFNRAIVELVQSMLGSITDHFEMISLQRDGEAWVIKFYVSTLDETDSDCIDDIVTQFEAFQDEMGNVISTTAVGNEFILTNNDTTRTVFLRHR